MTTTELTRALPLVSRRGSYNRDTWTFEASDAVRGMTDTELLTYCRYTPYFGGKVERTAAQIIVTAYTD